jgi:hypothetical protein
MPRRSYAGNIIRNYKPIIQQACIDTLHNASTDIQGNLRDVVRNWKNKPDFKDNMLILKKRIEVTIKPTGKKKAVKIFGYIDQGTKGPYLIPKFPRPGRLLKFQAGYSAMTQPVARYNVGSGQSFGNWVSKKQVRHPGIKKRDFIKTFWRDLAPPLHIRLQIELNRQLA